VENEMIPGLIHVMRDPSSVDGTAIITGLERLSQYVRDSLNRGLVMYEIGSFAGEGAEIFARYFSEVHCCDLWQDYPLTGAVAKYTWPRIEASFDARCASAKNIFKHKGDATEVAKTVPDESLDFVYIDADHKYASVMKDLAAWVSKVRPNGFIGGHDYTFYTVDVVRAVTDFFRFKDDEEIVLFHDGSWLLQKIPKEASK
jgi:hypothetical protein